MVNLVLRWIGRIALTLVVLVLASIVTTVVIQAFYDPGPCRDTFQVIVRPSSPTPLSPSPMCARPTWPQLVGLGAGAVAALCIWFWSRRLTRGPAIPAEG